MLAGGLVDYALGAAPFTGAFVVVHETSDARKKYLRYLKMGDGPFYVFYTPYHLPHVQIAATIGRAVETGDPTVAPLEKASCQVVARAKSDLADGSLLDGPGGFTCYGRIENVPDRTESASALPIALSPGARLVRSKKKDEPIMLGDVRFESPSKAFTLWREARAGLPNAV
jgi:predicted homoserine dehydrogenase-like protein